MKKYISLVLVLLVVIFSQTLVAGEKGKKDKKKKEYKFTNKIEIPTTPVKNQARTGTCWSYATTSFIETEVMRKQKGEYDLSEMFFVRYAYPKKAIKFVRYQGLANFSEGGQAHDVFNVIKEYGIVPEDAYTGLNYGYDYHHHGELTGIMAEILDNSLENKAGFTGKCLEVINATLDIYLGKVPQKFIYNGTEYTPKTFAAELGINADDYIELTSYSIYPFYQKVDLEVPDNWSHDLYYNVPVKELMAIINNAFENGYSVNWDGDVSERGFSHRNRVAIIPENNPKKMDESERLKWESLNKKEREKMLYDFNGPRKEMKIDQVKRQESFDIFKTTDDHLMHLIGTATDQNGTLYYITKNSWGVDGNDMGGKLYMSESFVKLKTIAIQVHKDAIPEDIRTKLNIK